MFGDGCKGCGNSLVPDYRINLIAPAAIPDEDFDKFSSTLKEVLAFIKHSRDADKLEHIVNTDPAFRELGRKEVDVLNNCVNANLVMNEEEEVVDVCEAIQTIADRAAKKAVEEAAKEAEKAVKAAEEAAKEAEKAAREAAEKAAREAAEKAAQERIKTLADNVEKFMKKMNFPAEQVMDILEVSEEDRNHIRKLV